MKKLIAILLLICSLTLCLTSCKTPNGDSDKETKYQNALSSIEAGDYEQAHETLKELGDYEDAKQMLERFVWMPVRASEGEGGDSDDELTITASYHAETNVIQIVCSFEGYGECEKIDMYLNADGQIEKEIFSEEAEDETEIEEIVKYEYDENGNLSKEFEVDPETEEIERTVEYTYNAKGELIQTTHTYSDDETVMTGTYSYTYDDSGRLIEKVRSDTYYYTTITAYTYNENGQLIKETETGPYDIQYVTEYTYDANGNISKLNYDGDIIGFTYAMVYLPFDNASEITKRVFEVMWNW